MKKSYVIGLFIICGILLFSCFDGKSEFPTIPNEISKLKEDIRLSIKGKGLSIPIGFHQDSLQIQIRAYECGYKQVNGWAITKFAPKNNKKLGIWAYNGSPSWSELHNKYGFNQIAVSNVQSYNVAKQAGFIDDNIMLIIPNYSSAYSLINALPQVKYYLVDEPFEREMYNTTTLRLVASMIHDVNPNSKMMMVSYKWPTVPYNLPWSLDTYGDKYKSVLDYASNSYIMCDEYHGNIFGTVTDYWSKYRDYYGSGKNISQWMNVGINNTFSGSGNSLDDLMEQANNLGIDNLWLFASGLSNPDNIYNFCLSAFSAGWLRGYAQDIILIYRCYLPDPCENCDPNSPDSWYLEEVYYVPGYYEVYP